MKIIRKILTPLAMTEFSQEIFDCAVDVAVKYDAEILVLSVISLRDIESIAGVAAMGYAVDENQYIQDVKKERQVMMDEIVEKNGFPSKRVKILFRTGHPADEIIHTIVRESPELVVMGTRGRSSLKSTIVGDVAKQVFQRSPVPVLSYRGEACRKRLLKRIHMD